MAILNTFLFEFIILYWSTFLFSGRSGSVRNLFGIRSGSVWANFGRKCSEPTKFKISKVFYLCGRRRRRGDLLAAVPSPAARRAPAAAATAAQIENFCEKFFEIP